ncbi:hypothetical protein acdb102_40430 [Acidothermaceae bacterium B102]|nr:hypothetical protein acdb102_40430 [Acidothermaceae bacterium B102]
MPAELCGVVLAAGAGTRLRPLTDELPKALCPVGNRPLVDLALDRLLSLGCTDVAVNVHAFPSLMSSHLEGRAFLSYERPVALGTAGALGALRPWIGGRATIVTNADAYLVGPLEELLSGWSGTTIRLGVVTDELRPDFEGRRYAGVCVMPWSDVSGLDAVPSGLYEVSWAAAERAGRLELIDLEGPFVDCGTPTDYLAANLLASGGETVVGEGAVLLGSAERCVLWPGARVEADETLRDVIRTAKGLTVQA